LVLGGLIRDRVETQDRGVPFMKNIPIIGYLFGAKVRTITKTELLMLVTPRVIGTALDAARITDEIRRATPELEDTFRRSPRQPRSRRRRARASRRRCPRRRPSRWCPARTRLR